MCPGDHRLTDCPVYAGLMVEERWNLVKSKGCCFGCLVQGHRLSDCEHRNNCDKGRCTKWHPDSLHPDGRRAGEKDKAVFSSIGSKSHDVCLGVVPLRVEGPRGSECVYALIDNGADTH